MTQCQRCGRDKTRLTNACTVCGAAAAAPAPVRPSAIASSAGAVATPAAAVAATKACPACAEQILAAAQKCKHCGHVMGQALGSRAAAPAANGKPVCQACGGAMQKKTVTSGQAAGCAMALICFALGIGLCFWPVVGWVLGPLLIIISLFMGGKRNKVWKCTSCSAVIPRA